MNPTGNFRSSRFLVLLILGLLLPILVSKADENSPTKSAPTPAYSFRVNNDGLILDDAGTPVAPADIPDHFTKLGISPGTVLTLLISGPDSVKKLTATIRAFGPGYPKIIVKNYELGDKVGRFEIPASTPASIHASIDAAYPGKSYPVANVHGDLVTFLSARALELRPGPIPDKIQYRYAENSVVVDAAKRLGDHLLSGADASPHFWGNAVVVQSGAWKILKSNEALGKDLAIRFQASIRLASGVVQLPQILLRNPADLQLIDEKIRKMIVEDGGGQIRALSSEEMKLWWPFISYDITEPTLVLETAQGAHRFVFGFTLGGAALLEDLNGLPRVSGGQ